jgi:hypothetical protein
VTVVLLRLRVPFVIVGPAAVLLWMFILTAKICFVQATISLAHQDSSPDRSTLCPALDTGFAHHFPCVLPSVLLHIGLGFV